MKLKLQIKNETETDALALLLVRQSFPGFLIGMEGDLGAGKTRFAKGVAKALGIKEVVKSPTFNILKTYSQGNIFFYHIDAYRLEGSKEDLGLEEYIEGDGFCFVEWSSFIEYLMQKEYLKITITIIDENKREFLLETTSLKYKTIIEQVKKIWK